MKYKIGDKVKLLENGGCMANFVGKYAKIIDIKERTISLEFDDYNEYLHDCSGKGKVVIAGTLITL